MKDLIIIVITILMTFPITHLLMKKGMTMDFNLTDETKTDLAKFFYIPYLNVFISFFYLIWVIVKFKRPV